MKIMVLSRFKIFPPIFGAARRIYSIVYYFSKNYEIIIFSCVVGKNEQKTELPVKLYTVNLSNFLMLFAPSTLFKLIRVVRYEKPNLIISETIWTGLHSLVIKLLFNISYIIDEHNVEYVRLQRLRYGKVLWPFIKSVERIVCKYADKVLCVSEVDKFFLINMGVENRKIYVMPNGVERRVFYPCEYKRNKIRKILGLKPNEKAVLFFGALDYYPNKEAVNVILNVIAPRIEMKIPNVKFIIIGRNPPVCTKKNVLFLSTVDHIQDYINASDVVVCPLKCGGGTRIKILEAIACGKKVVSTSIGAEGLPIKEIGGNLEIFDDWDSFADKVMQLISSPIEINVPEHFINKYSWERIISEFEHFVLTNLSTTTLRKRNMSHSFNKTKKRFS